MNNATINFEVLKQVLSFMQRNDRNGTWLEWLEEIQANESTLDKDYIITTLSDWYENSKDEKYLEIRQLVFTV